MSKLSPTSYVGINQDIAPTIHKTNLAFIFRDTSNNKLLVPNVTIELTTTHEDQKYHALKLV